MTNDEVLTIKEVAALLKLAEKTVYLMAQEGEIPAFKARGQWRVRRSDLDAWIESKTGDTWQRNAGAGPRHGVKRGEKSDAKRAVVG